MNQKKVILFVRLNVKLNTSSNAVIEQLVARWSANAQNGVCPELKISYREVMGVRIPLTAYGVVVQLGRTSPLQGEDFGFDSRRLH